MLTVRGATTINNDDRNEVLSETKIMIEEVIKANNINIDDISSILFTATKDVKSVYPAVSARDIGILNASLMCVQEMYVEGSLAKCIRLMLTCKANGRSQKDVKHIYLNNAEDLRPDLKE